MAGVVDALEAGQLDIVAPGEAIYATQPNGSYAMMSGTSMATPVVAGTVATDSGLRIQVTAVGDDTALAGIGRLVADAQNSTSRAQRIADTAAGWLFWFAAGSAIITAAGFDHYETSNYARPGHHSSHNQGYWRGEDYLGLGPSAVSTLDGIRWKNVADTARYVAQVQSIGHALTESETLDHEARRLERIALGLRTKDGISLDLLNPDAVTRARHLADEGLARIDGSQLILIHHGRALVDPIAAELV